jgi:branched-chain amino acid transport system ATP-binding protein
MSLLSVRNVTAAYGKVVALANVSLHVDAGELVSLIGANGAGKSTLMKAIMGMVAVSTGDVQFDRRTLIGLRPHAIARLGIAYVPEGRGALRELSVRENLRLGAFSRPWDQETRADFDRVVARFPVLAERMGQAAGTLSGGEQQMLVIGRALMSRPRLLLLDEPSLGLAPLMGAQIFDIIRGLNEQGVPVLLVEQNARAALRLAKRGYVLETGRIVQEGEGLAESRHVQEAYLGVSPQG